MNAAAFLNLWLGNLGSSVYALLLYAFAALAVFYLVPARFRTGRAAALLIESILFYAFCDLRYLPLLAAETIGTWLLGMAMDRVLNGPGTSAEENASCGDENHAEGDESGLEKSLPHGYGNFHNKGQNRKGQNRKKADGLLILGIVLTAAVLAGFKYAGLFKDFLHPGEEIDRLVMPIGISYYTFREISYLADIRLRKRRAERSLLYYSTYILFFPQMLSGPIARSEGMLERLHEGARFDRTLAGEGALLLVSGMFKKVVIADRISGYVNTVFQSYENDPSVALWLALFLNSVYIYCDFAGYSEIAIGLTRLFGLPCDLNFNLPYLSRNMKEFWRRWHISLSSWLRDYIYIPLGGSRVSSFRTKLNVMTVFVVCGLWHGSGLTYLVWGVYHGIWNILTPRKKAKSLDAVNPEEKYYERKRCHGKWKSGCHEDNPAGGKENALYRSRTIHWRDFLCSCGVFLVASFGWLLFRSSSMSAAAGYFLHLFRGFSLSLASLTAAILPFTGDSSCAAYFLTAVIMMVILFVMEWDERYHEERWKRMRIFRTGLLLVLILLFGMTGSGSFLYANY